MSFYFSPAALYNWPLFGQIDIPNATIGYFDSASQLLIIVTDSAIVSLVYKNVGDKLHLFRDDVFLKEVPYGDCGITTTRWKEVSCEISDTKKVMVCEKEGVDTKFDVPKYNAARLNHLLTHRVEAPARSPWREPRYMSMNLPISYQWSAAMSSYYGPAIARLLREY